MLICEPNITKKTHFSKKKRYNFLNDREMLLKIWYENLKPISKTCSKYKLVYFHTSDKFTVTVHDDPAGLSRAAGKALNARQ